MSIKKVGAVAAAALVMTSLAMSASASNLSNDADTDTAAVCYMASEVDETGVASVRAVDVDLSDIDWDNVLPGTPVPVGEVDPDTVSVCYAVTEDGGVATVYAVEDVDLSNMDFSEMLEATPVPVGFVDPGTVPGGFTTQAKPAEK